MEPSTPPITGDTKALADAVDELFLETPAPVAAVLNTPVAALPVKTAAEPKKQADEGKKPGTEPTKQPIKATEPAEPKKRTAEPTKQPALAALTEPATATTVGRGTKMPTDSKAEKSEVVAAAEAEEAPESLESLAKAFEILQGVAAQPLDGATAAKIVRLNRRLRPHYIRYIATREKVAAACGTKIGEGKYSVPPERVEEYQAGMEVTRLEMHVVPLDQKIDCKALAALKISAEALEVLAPLLTGI